MASINQLAGMSLLIVVAASACFVVASGQDVDQATEMIQGVGTEPNRHLLGTTKVSEAQNYYRPSHNHHNHGGL